MAFAFLVTNSYAQTSFGARTAGIGGFSVGMKDLWAAENNLAALAFHNKKEVGVYHQNKYNLKELSHTAFLASLPLKKASLGLSISRFGFNLYNENKFSLGYGQLLSNDFALGLQLNYHSTVIAEGYGNNKSLSANIGLLTMLSDELQIAVLLINPTKARLSDYEDERYQTLIRLGILYAFSKKVFLASELERSMNTKSILKVGMEYFFQNCIYLRAGMSTNPQLSSFGFGYNRKAIKVDFASTYHTSLGVSPQISIQFLIEHSKNSE